MKLPSLHFLSRMLLLFGSLLFLTACYDRESKMAAQTTQFKYSINVGYPKDYYALYERSQSYLMNDKGEPMLYFGGRIGSGAGWGTGSQNTLLSLKNVMPAAFKVRWFSPTEDQFWEGEFPLPQQKLYQLVKQGYRHPFYQNKQVTYSEFTINVAPGGWVVWWLGGGAQTIQIGAFQAKKIEMDWQEFARDAFVYAPNKTKSEFIADSIDDGREPDRIWQEIKTGTLPTDSAPWKRLQQKYPWRMQLNSPFVLQYFRAWHVNGENLFTYSDDVTEYQNRAVPYRMALVFLKPNQQLDKISLELDKEQTIAAYNKLGGAEHSEPLEFYLEMTEDLDQATIYLKNRQEQIELLIKRIYLDDL